MSEIVHIPFHGDDLLATLVDGKPYVVLKPAMEALGVDPWSQAEKLKSKSWACTRLIPVQVPGDVQRREMVAVDVRTLLMLLATIDENRVAEHVKPKLIAYQAEVAEVIEQHFTVPRPRSQIDVLRAALDQIEAAQATATEAKVIAQHSEARLDAIEGRHDWYAALGYAKLQGWPTDRQWLQRLGYRAGSIGRAAGLPVSKVQHGLYGQVNQWPAWCWDQAYQDLDAEAGVA